MNDEEKIMQNHFRDLASWSYHHGVPRFSGFLDTAGQNLLLTSGINTGVWLYGGYEDAERVVACFCEEEPEYGAYPIVAVRISPANQRFAGNLSHRDYLGALMGLGIERDCLGDIMAGQGDAWVFCLRSIAEYIAENLTGVGRTTVSCEICPAGEAVLKEQAFEELVEPLASERIDVAVARLAKCSRSGALELLSKDRVSINRRLCNSASAKLKPGDIISIRGLGRFKYEGIAYTGKKGTDHGKFLKYV